MAIKPSPTIAGKLRKLFNNNKQTIEPAIGDSIPGGSGGGALYVNIAYVDNPSKSGTRGNSVEPVAMALDKTYKEIEDAISAGKAVIFREHVAKYENMFDLYALETYGFYEENNVYMVRVYSPSREGLFTSETDTGVMYLSADEPAI